MATANNSRPLLMRQTTTRTQGAFLISILLAIAALTHTALAQEPTPPVTQSVPTLKEWWRADNMGYGLNGATWIDNFYNGKGALVVSTPNGVQTWQLRYPWDTVNIFTWAGGNANLKTGDFNGDGLKDFIDANGRIYKGVQNGFPVLTKISTSHPDAIGDFNGDGKDDVFSFRASFWYKEAIGHVQFGNDLNDTSLRAVTIEREQPFDTLWSTLTCYTRPDGGLGVIMCGRPYYDSKGNATWMRDGYKLYSVNFAAGSSVPLVAALDSLIINNYRKQVVQSICSIASYDDKILLIANENVDGNIEKIELNCYDISNSELRKIASLPVRYRSDMTLLQHSMDGDSIPDFILRTYDGVGFTRSVVSGLIKNGVLNVKFTHVSNQPMNSFLPTGISISDISGDSIPDLIVTDSRFLILFNDKVLFIEDEISPSIEGLVSPNPIVRTGTLSFRMYSKYSQSINITLNDNTGRIVLNLKEQLNNNAKVFSVSLSGYNLSAGSYTLVIKPEFGHSKNYPLIIE